MKYLMILGAAILIGAVSVVLAVAANKPSATDADEAQAIHDYLHGPANLAVRFRPKESVIGPEVTTRPHPRRTELFVAGVTGQADRAEIVAKLRAAQMKRGWKPIEVEFREAYINHVIAGGVVSRDEGKLIERVSIP
ncbi:MAG: hypothetical protein R3F20_18950 [Planctomycetota bacterium]